MPILPLLGLIFTVIETAIKIAQYLQEHPQVTQEAKAALNSVSQALGAAQMHVEAATYATPLGNNIESP